MNIEGKGEVTQRDLVKNCLRMRPDRIIIGECRGGEALDMLQAMNTGHDGSMTTVHANNTRDALGRLEVMIAMAGYDIPIAALRHADRQRRADCRAGRRVDRRPAKGHQPSAKSPAWKGNNIQMHDLFTVRAERRRCRRTCDRPVYRHRHSPARSPSGSKAAAFGCRPICSLGECLNACRRRP